MACIFGCFSQFFTAVLAVTRLSKVVAPFIRLKQRYIFGYLAFHIIYMLGANGAYYAMDAFYSKQDDMLKLMKLMEDVCFWSYFLHCIVGVLASMVTVFYLLIERTRNPTTASKYLTSSVTLLLLNLPYILTIVLIGGVQWEASWRLNSREIVFAWVPVFTSALDPVIVLTRKREVKEKVVATFRMMKQGLTKSLVVSSQGADKSISQPV